MVARTGSQEVQAALVHPRCDRFRIDRRDPSYLKLALWISLEVAPLAEDPPSNLGITMKLTSSQRRKQTQGPSTAPDDSRANRSAPLEMTNCGMEMGRRDAGTTKPSLQLRLRAVAASI